MDNYHGLKVKFKEKQKGAKSPERRGHNYHGGCYKTIKIKAAASIING